MKKPLVILGIGCIVLVLIIVFLIKGPVKEKREGLVHEARYAAEKMLNAMKEGDFDAAFEYVDFKSVKAEVSRVYEDLPEEHRRKRMEIFDKQFTKDYMKKQAAQQYKEGSFDYEILDVADIDGAGVVEIGVMLKEKGKPPTKIVLPVKRVGGEWKVGKLVMPSS